MLSEFQESAVECGALCVAGMTQGAPPFHFFLSLPMCDRH